MTQCLNFIKILDLKIKYPNLKIDFKTHIGKNAQIVCVDGGKLSISKSHILDGSIIFCDTEAELDIKNSFIGSHCLISAKNKISIGEKCLIAEMVVIRDHNHIFEIGKDMADSGFSTSPITIERNVWIGAKASILNGVTLAEGSVIGSNAVVTHSTKSHSINVGVPAKEIKNYKDQEYHI